MLNLTNMLRAPLRDYRVTMHRKSCLNANQSARKVVVYVSAASDSDALREAEKLPGRAAFKAIEAKEIK